MSDETPWNHYEDESLPVIKNEKNDDMVTDDDDDGDLAGSFSNLQIEAIFSRAQRFRRTAPVATTWDDTSDSGSDAEVVGTIHPSDQPWFEALECKVVRELALDEALDEFEDAYDLDVPPKLRPFMAKFQAKAVHKTSPDSGRSSRHGVPPQRRSRFCPSPRVRRLEPRRHFPGQAPARWRAAVRFPGVLNLT